jgi:hypothetical protein
VVQRIYDEQNFKNAGEYTPILKLLKQNIQKGEKGVTVQSKLFITGDVSGNEYSLKAMFTAELNYRPVGVSTGVESGELIQPIRVEMRAPISDEQLGNPKFSVRDNPNFFGKKNHDGIFPRLMKKLGDEILNTVNPDDVLNKITEILIPTNVDPEFINKEQ